jgi:hypothetical protein
MIKVLAAGRELGVDPSGNRPSGELWLTPEQLRNVTGWDLKPEGLCKDDACIPLTAGRLEKLVEGDQVNASGLWNALERPILSDDAGTTWMLGEAAEDRTRQLESLQAPDFTLPDIDGEFHSLSDYRGKKVLIASWASW